MRLIKWLDEHLEETLMIILLIIIACVTISRSLSEKFPGSHPLPGLKNFAGSCGSGAYSFPSPIPFGWRICSASVFSSIFFPRP